MRTVLILLAAVAVCVLPGVGALLAFRVRRWLWVFGVAPAVSVGVATVTSILCALVGLPYGPAALGVVTALLLALGGYWWWAERRRAERGADRGAEKISASLVARWRRQPSWQRGGLAGGFVLVVGGVAMSMLSWLRGMAFNLATLPQEHDTIVHSELTAYIMRTGRGAPWQVLPVDLMSGQPVQFYPSGFHLLAAATGSLTGNPITGLNSVTVVLLAAWLPIGAAVLAYVAASRIRLGAGATMLVAGIASIVAAGLYKPTFTLVTEGGVLPNAAEMVLVPGLVAAILTLRRRDWLAGIVIGIGCAGLVTLHPSAVVTVGVSVVAWWVGDLLTKGGPRRVREQLPPLVLAVVAAGIVAAPTILGAASLGGRTASFPPDFAAKPFGPALGSALDLVFAGYLPFNGTTQVAPTLLTLVGVGAVLMTRRPLGLFTAWAAWVIVLVAAYLNPGEGPDSLITGFLYNGIMRISSHVYLFVPALCGLGVVLPTIAFVRWLRARTSLRLRVGWAFTVLVLVLGAAYIAVPGRQYTVITSDYIGIRYGHQNIGRVTQDDLSAFDYLAAHVQPGQRVMNSANDGSTYMYVLKDIPVVNDTTLGIAAQPYTYHLLEWFNQYPKDVDIRQTLINLNVGWVYVDSNPPPIGASGSPDNWAGDGLFSFAPGLSALGGLPGLTPVYTHGSVHVYRLDLNVLRAMPLS